MAILRVLYRNDTRLPEFGWLVDAAQAAAFRDEGAKNDLCSWCGRATGRAAGGAIVCTACDTAG